MKTDPIISDTVANLPHVRRAMAQAQKLHGHKREDRTASGNPDVKAPRGALPLTESAIEELTAAARLLRADMPGLAVDALYVAQGRVREALLALTVA